MKSISVKNKIWEGDVRPSLLCWAIRKEASGTNFITSLVWLSLGSNPWWELYHWPTAAESARTRALPLTHCCRISWDRWFFHLPLASRTFQGHIIILFTFWKYKKYFQICLHNPAKGHYGMGSMQFCFKNGLFLRIKRSDTIQQVKICLHSF